ncbi:bifunctional riboflavin kinase/FAD synthetase [bacterium]|nr:bifunctional riboflavin kinase/FAD synthetase [bacterium]
MKLIRDLKKFPASLRGGAITIGNFDGVHRGHATIINRLKHHASAVGGAAIVFTFDPHPVRVLRPDQAPAPLTWTDRKADLLAELGVDVVVAYPTDRDLLSLTHDDFFAKIVQQQLGAKAMIEGPNFFFGKDRGGDVEVLKRLCDSSDIELEIVTPIEDRSQLISSSRIRDLIAEGDVGPAAQMLTHPYRIRGMVTHGAARGAKIGFPTANLDAIDTLVPAPGVYAGRTYIDGRSHWSAIHIGPNPTFGENVLKVESHILDFERSLYGSVVEVDFISRLRDILRFESQESLIQQLAIDIGAARTVASSWPALP